MQQPSPAGPWLPGKTPDLRGSAQITNQDFIYICSKPLNPEPLNRFQLKIRFFEAQNQGFPDLLFIYGKPY